MANKCQDCSVPRDLSMITIVDWSERKNPVWFERLELEREVEGLYDAYSAELLSYAGTMVRRGDGAGDAIQEIFLRYFVERSYGRVIENPRAWLYRVLRNYLLDRLDRAAVEREVGDVDFEQVPDPGEGAEARVESAQMAEELCSEMSGREMDCLRLRAGGASYEEIATTLGIRCGTVSALLTRAHKKLRKGEGGRERAPAETLAALKYLLAGGTQ